MSGSFKIVPTQASYIFSTTGPQKTMSYLRLERNETDRNKQFVSVENFSIFLLLVTMVPILQEVRLFLGGWKGLWCLQLIDFPCQCGEWDVKYFDYRMPPRKKAMDDAAELLELGELPGGANDVQGGMMEFVRWLAM